MILVFSNEGELMFSWNKHDSIKDYLDYFLIGNDKKYYEDKWVSGWVMKGSNDEYCIQCIEKDRGRFRRTIIDTKYKDIILSQRGNIYCQREISWLESWILRRREDRLNRIGI